MKHGLSESTVERIQSVLAHFPDVDFLRGKSLVRRPAAASPSYERRSK